MKTLKTILEGRYHRGISPLLKKAKLYRKKGDVLGLATAQVALSDLRNKGMTAVGKPPPKKRKPRALPTGDNTHRVYHHVDKLDAAGTNRGAFEDAFGAMKSDPSLSPKDHRDIAYHYSKGGTAIKSKKMAHAEIAKRFVEKVRTAAKNETAFKMRPL